MVVKDKRREICTSKMRLLNPSMFESSQRLSEKEVSAITAHLATNVPCIANVFKNDAEIIREVVRSATVVDVDNMNTSDGKPDYLYKRGDVANFCILVLSGRVMVLAGKDNFKAELGPWSAIGQDCLVAANGSFTPDFDAFVSSGRAKYLRITSHVYTEEERVIPILSKRRDTFKDVLELYRSTEEGEQHTSMPLLSAEGDLDSSHVEGLLRRQSFSIRRKPSLGGEPQDIQHADEVVSRNRLTSEDDTVESKTEDMLGTTTSILSSYQNDSK
jgi:CRP-like cAMP-binding protein